MIKLKVHAPDQVPTRVSCFISGLLGPLFLTTGLALLINRSGVAGMLALAGREPLLVMLAGLLSLLAGTAILQVHHLWQGWPVLVTLVGWLAVLTGAIRVLAPVQSADLAALWASSPGAVWLMAVVLLALGAFLSWQAWRDH